MGRSIRNKPKNRGSTVSDAQLQTKADTSVVTALETTVNEKADATTVSALQTTVDALSVVEANPSATATDHLTKMTVGSTTYSIVPSGIIVMWSGSSIPSGWHLCDGTNNTPDLRDRFIVGSGNQYSTGDTGGAESVTLQTAHLPAHTHTFSSSTDLAGSHTHSYLSANNYSGYPDGWSDTNNSVGYWRQGTRNLTTTSASDHTHSFSGTTNSTGSDTAHENRPPYYALAFIMKA